VYGPESIGTVIQGNWVGTSPANAQLPNGSAGIYLASAVETLVGGFEQGAGNTIAYNGLRGIFAPESVAGSFFGNRIHDNGSLGIDIDEAGPVENDADDEDLGANDVQNFPVLQSAIVSNGMLQVTGFLETAPSSDFTVEVFGQPSCDESGLGEAEEPLDHAVVQTDAGGKATFALPLPMFAATGFVTAIATDAAGNSSELSPCLALGPPLPGVIGFWAQQFVIGEGAQLRVAVVRSQGNAGAVSVMLTAIDESATSPADYGSVPTQITFADGEVVKTFWIPIMADLDANEGQEQFKLHLSSPTNGATLGNFADATVIIPDATLGMPGLSVSDATGAEPATGTSTLRFTVSLTATNHPVTLRVYTEDGSAEAGADYVSFDQQITFLPGELQKYVDITILADAVDEPTEGFSLRLASVAGGGALVATDSLGIGAIRKDELFADGFE
jgi:hypothetical protein